jgi:hypothetical protein
MLNLKVIISAEVRIPGQDYSVSVLHFTNPINGACNEPFVYVIQRILVGYDK